MAKAAETKKLIVCIDAGHGGYDPGCTADNDPGPKVDLVEEEDINLAVAHLVAAELARLGHAAVLTRATDCHPSNAQRAALANRVKADLYLAIHCNASDKATAQGFEVIRAFGSQRGRTVAAALVERLSAGNPRIKARPTPIKTDLELGRGLAFANGLPVLRKTKMPAVLVELGFLTNPKDRAALTDPVWQACMADRLACGLVNAALALGMIGAGK